MGTGWNTFPDSSTTPRKGATGFESKCGSNGQAGKTKQHNQSVTGSACPSEVPVAWLVYGQSRAEERQPGRVG